MVAVEVVTVGSPIRTRRRNASAAAAAKLRVHAKDGPLREDIRFLGTLLGECLRAQEGDAAFDLVERIRQTAPAGLATFEGIMQQLSDHAFRAYRHLVYETPGFKDYFFATTPITEIADLNLGSRPASRKLMDKKNRKIEDLRAIPWGFSSGQCRLLLPGWYGFGSAVKAMLDAAPDEKSRKAVVATLKHIVKTWPFFRTLLSNMDMVLAKTDLAVASRYAALCEDPALRKTASGSQRPPVRERLRQD